MKNKKIEISNDEPKERDKEFERILRTGYKIKTTLTDIKIKIKKKNKLYTIEGFLDKELIFEIYSKKTDIKYNDMNILFQTDYYWFKLAEQREICFRLIEINTLIEDIHRYIKKEPINNKY